MRRGGVGGALGVSSQLLGVQPMTPAYLHIDARPSLPSRARAMSIMAALGLVTALISSLPSPLPDIRLSDPDILINARAVPLHAGIAFGAMIAGILWLWVNRDS